MLNGDATADHLVVCAPCRDQVAEFIRLFAHAAEYQPPSVVAWKAAHVKGKGPNPASACPGCGGRKKPEYDTCFACSGMELCDSCGENYYQSGQYTECYACA